MVKFLKDIKSHYEYIFIDVPEVGVISNATIISSNMDGVMYVVGANETDLNHATSSEEGRS